MAWKFHLKPAKALGNSKLQTCPMETYSLMEGLEFYIPPPPPYGYKMEYPNYFLEHSFKHVLAGAKHEPNFAANRDIGINLIKNFNPLRKKWAKRCGCVGPRNCLRIFKLSKSVVNGKESILAQSTCHMASIQLSHREGGWEKLDISTA